MSVLSPALNHLTHQDLGFDEVDENAMPNDNLLTGPSCPKRNNLHSEKAKSDRPRSDIVSLSSDVSEDFIAFSDIPIY